MAVDIRKSPAHGRGYDSATARRLALELGGVAVPARWRAGESVWEFGGPGWNPVGLPHIVVLPVQDSRERLEYRVLADNMGPTRTAAEVTP